MDELRSIFRRNISAILWVSLFSIFVNVLILTGPLYMLQVYDRVLPSRSEPTLIALTVLIAGLFAAMGLLDFLRGRIGARIGARIQSDLDPRVFSASLMAPVKLARVALTSLADLEAIRRFFAAPVAFSLLDLVFTPLFVAAIFTFHSYLGWLAVAGGALLVSISLLNQLLSRNAGDTAAIKAAKATRFAEQVRSNPETVRGLGMTAAAEARWNTERFEALQAEVSLQDRNGGFGSITKSLRFFLQSAMLGMGAWLVLQGELSAGAMIAGSILLGRALAPIEQLIGGWGMVQRARKGWSSLGELLDEVPPERERMALDRPRSQLRVDGVTVMRPGSNKPILNKVSFSLDPGQALGVIGESASGKSSIARVLTGFWAPVAGKVTLGGASLDQYPPETLADYVGYLPQDVVLFDGTIAQNIARMRSAPDPEAIRSAAKAAGAHQMILDLAQGYDTIVGASGAALSGGQKQRIGLARALFNEPEVLVLDEPNSNLDTPGSAAVNETIQRMKADGKSAIVMAHRPAALAQCDLVLVMKDGAVAGFGPRDEVLRKHVVNHAQIRKGKVARVAE